MTNGGSGSGARDKRTFLQWEIWQVDWLHEDGTSKPRPALLLSPSGFNVSHDELWFVKITGTDRSTPNRVKLEEKSPMFATTGLTKSCYIYPENIKKIAKSSIRRKRGYVDRFFGQQVYAEVCRLSGWKPV